MFCHSIKHANSVFGIIYKHYEFMRFVTKREYTHHVCIRLTILNEFMVKSLLLINKLNICACFCKLRLVIM